ncbi:hypothetical protein [Sulfitobacter sp. 1A15299]|uniref:hypothetical protein n=1 Tax=Sulfitobacter sp. 1A15299 TaxID=3368598 RepID=UPI003746E2BB
MADSIQDREKSLTFGGAYIGFGATANLLKTFCAELAVAVLFAATALRDCSGLLWLCL